MFEGNRSDPRNPELVAMFRFIGVCDEGGTGIPKIIRAWRTLGFKNPTIDVGTERYEFSIKLRHIHLISEEDRIWLGTLGGDWNESEQLALVMAKHDGDVDNFRLRQLTNQHPADVTKILRSLKSRDLLKMIGTGHKARYELGDRVINNLFFTPTSSLQINDKNYTTNDKNYTTNDKNYTTNDKNYTTNDKNYTLIEATEVWSKLEELSLTFTNKQRAKPEERETSIIRLLETAPLSINELIELTGLSKSYLHQRLQALTQKGKVVFLYPQQPNHPMQKYCLLAEIERSKI